MIDRGKRNVLGVGISAVDYAAAVERITQAARHRQPLAVSALAVHGLMTGVLDREHRHRLNRFDLLVPDGQPVRWALNALHRTKLRERVYGPTLMLKTCERAAREGLSIFLYGSTPQVLEALKESLLQRYPNLQIAGMMPSRFRQVTPEERDTIAATIRASGASITFVGLGCPRQEVWAFEMREALSMPVLAVGAAFNFHAGLLPQAPPGLQSRGLEWLFRLIQEPRRLWKRYLVLNPLFLTLLAFQFIGLHAPDSRRLRPPREELRYG